MGRDERRGDDGRRHVMVRSTGMLEIGVMQQPGWTECHAYPSDDLERDKQMFCCIS